MLGGAQGDRAQRRLARGPPGRGHLQPMVQAVPQQMGEGVLDLLQDRAVHFGIAADDDQLGLFAQVARHVAHHAREGVEDG